MLFERKPLKAVQLTPNKIERLRKQYSEGVFEIVIDDKRALFKVPNSKEIKKAVKDALKNDAIKAGLKLFERTFLGGDKELIESETYQKACLDQHWVFIKEKVKNVLPQYNELI